MSNLSLHDDITVAQASDPGVLREENQDALKFFEPSDDERFEKLGRLFVVADGVGGHPGGDTAAWTAVEIIHRSYAMSDGADPADALQKAFAQANREIFEESKRESHLFGMGTTCTAIALRGAEAWLAHVGDTRAYLLRDGQLLQLTKDHSAAWYLYEEGKVSKREYEKHPKSRVIERSIGFQSRVRVDVSTRPLAVRPYDILLICSDGLTGPVSDETICQVVRESPPDEACQKLVELANRAGGPDNITVQIIRVHRVPEAASATDPGPSDG